MILTLFICRDLEGWLCINQTFMVRCQNKWLIPKILAFCHAIIAALMIRMKGKGVMGCWVSVGARLLACRDFQWIKLLLFVTHNGKGRGNIFTYIFCSNTCYFDTLVEGGGRWWLIMTHEMYGFYNLCTNLLRNSSDHLKS